MTIECLIKTEGEMLDEEWEIIFTIIKAFASKQNMEATQNQH